MTTKPAFPALGAPRGRRASHVEDLALPKSLKSGNFTPAKAVIRWMSLKIPIRYSPAGGTPHGQA